MAAAFLRIEPTISTLFTRASKHRDSTARIRIFLLSRAQRSAADATDRDGIRAYLALTRERPTIETTSGATSFHETRFSTNALSRAPMEQRAQIAEEASQTSRYDSPGIRG